MERREWRYYIFQKTTWKRLSLICNLYTIITRWRNARKEKIITSNKKKLWIIGARNERTTKELVTWERKCQGCSNLVELDQVRVTTTKLGANLKDVEVELQFHELLLVQREFNKVKDGKVEFKNVNERLQHVSKDLDALVLKGNCTNQWAQTFGHQIQLMFRGAKVTNNPLPIKQTHYFNS